MKKAQASFSRALFLIVKSLMLELIRRRDFYVLLIITGIYVLAVITIQIVGIENAGTGTFLLNLGLFVSCFCAHILTLIISVRQMPEEMENRTIYPVLAKPIMRYMFIIAKWAGTSICGSISLIILFLISYLSTPKMETYSGALLFQMIILQLFSICLTAALGICFSLIFPLAINLILIGVVYALSSSILGVINNFYSGAFVNSIIRWIAAYIPDFSKLNLITRYTDGIAALSFGDFISLILYSLIFISMSLITGIIIFEKKAL